MVIILFLFIILGLLHFYLQNVVIPVKIISQQHKLLVLEERLSYVKDKSRISYPAYLAFIKVLKNTSKIIESDEGFEIWVKRYFQHITNDINKKAAFDNDELNKNILSITRSKDTEVKNILADYSKCISDSYIYSSLGWVIYVIPLIFYKRIKLDLKKDLQNYRTNLVQNIILYDQRTLCY